MRIPVAGRAPSALAPVLAAIRSALRPLRLPDTTEVSLAFVDDTTMRELNRRHRGIDRTTDVLSFGQTLPPGLRGPEAASHLHPDPDGVTRLGDIVISPAQAGQRARRARRPLVAEIAFLAAHGALHLVGYEDETPAGYREIIRLGKLATGGAYGARRNERRRRPLPEGGALRRTRALGRPGVSASRRASRRRK